MIVGEAKAYHKPKPCTICCKHPIALTVWCRYCNIDMVAICNQLGCFNEASQEIADHVKAYHPTEAATWGL